MAVTWQIERTTGSSRRTARALSKFPVPIPWVSADGVSGDALCQASQLEDALVACADMKRMCGFELARRVSHMRPEVRVLLMWRPFEGPEEAHRAHERGYAGIEEPFTPEQLCRRLTGLLAFPRAIGSEEKH